MKKRGPWKPGQSGNPKGRPPGVGEIGKLRAYLAGDLPGTREIRHVPAPHLTRCIGNVGCRWSYCLVRFGAATVSILSFGPRHSREGGLAGQVNPLIGQHGHDARRRHIGKARLVGHLHQAPALDLTQGVPKDWAHCAGPPIAAYETMARFPAL